MNGSQDPPNLPLIEGESAPRLGLVRTMLRAGSKLWNRVLGFEALWVGLFVVAGFWVLLPKGVLFAPRVEAGEIATRAYAATRDLLEEDTETTAEKQQAARDAVLPVYDFEPGVETELENELLQLFEVGRASGLSKKGAPAAALEQLLSASQLQTTEEQIKVLVAHEFSTELEDLLRSTATQILRRGLTQDKARLLENRDIGITLRNNETNVERVQLDLFRVVGFPEEAREVVDIDSRRWPDLTRQERQSLSDWLFQSLSPNLYLNRSETQARRDAAASGTVPVFRRIRAGQSIVRKGDEIDATAALFINGAYGKRSRVELALPMLGRLLLLSLGTFVVWLFVSREKSLVDQRERVFAGLLLLMSGSLVLIKFLFLTSEALSRFFEDPPLNGPEGYWPAIPFAAVTLIAFLLYGRSMALVVGVFVSVLAGQLVSSGGLGLTMYSLSGSLAAVLLIDQVKKRSGVTRAGLVIGGVNIVATLMILALDGERLLDLNATGMAVTTSLVGGLLAAALTSFAVPVLEALLGLTTDITLVELSNTNLPLLRRLAFEAPGTFQHSLMVANLAKAGCAEIGANATLAYTGGLYHDIGKTVRPGYFIENQQPGNNPHDDLAPALSAQIVIKHVEDGLLIGRDAGLPRVICDTIMQHHGTHLLSFFHSRAVEQDGEQSVDESGYRYPGPRPQNKVNGVIMLADAVEAASRTLKDGDRTRINNLVTKIFDSHEKDNQLDECDLTLADLRKIAAEFERVLATLHHRRVDYPGFDFDEPGKGPAHLRAVGQS